MTTIEQFTVHAATLLNTLLAAGRSRRKRAAATSFMARVICWVDLTEEIRRRIALVVAML